MVKILFKCCVILNTVAVVMKRKGLFFCWFFAVTVCVAEPEVWSEQEILRGTFSAVQEGARSNQIVRLSDWISQQLDAGCRLRTDDLVRLTAAADAITYLRLTEGLFLEVETERWLLADTGRLRLLAESLLPSDNLRNCFQCLEKLIEHDSDGKQKFFKLMLALSAVWDVPKRPQVHHQMGKEQLPYNRALIARYNYFKELYVSGDAKLPYEALSFKDLLFVVETPVPMSELQWARANESGTLENWGDKFSGIVYDRSRLSNGQYQWSNGPYTLAEIRRRGGICVDQTYYAVMTARAFGIPAFYISAAGKNGSHAWFSYMNAPGEWALNVGRYESEAYTTGWTSNPQTNEKITDHDITLSSERLVDRESMEQSDACMAIAISLINDLENRRNCAEQARKIDPLNRQAWDIELDALIAEENPRGLLRLFDKIEDTFKDHPDVVVESAEKIEPVLNAAGMEEEAGYLRRHLARKVDDDRDDLARFMGMDEITEWVDAGNIKRARRKMEDILEEHIEDGSKAFPMIRFYLKITEDTDQSKAAAKFLEEYIAEMFDSFYFDIARRRAALTFLLQAYMQTGDEDGIAETANRLADL